MEQRDYDMRTALHVAAAEGDAPETPGAACLTARPADCLCLSFYLSVFTSASLSVSLSLCPMNKLPPVEGSGGSESGQCRSLVCHQRPLLAHVVLAADGQ